MPCPFCHPEEDEEQVIVLENEHARFLQKPEVVLKGSGVIVPRRHRATVFDLTREEWNATYDLLQKAKQPLFVVREPVDSSCNAVETLRKASAGRCAMPRRRRIRQEPHAPLP